jgi:hypothetical protein
LAKRFRPGIRLAKDRTILHRMRRASVATVGVDHLRIASALAMFAWRRIIRLTGSASLDQVLWSRPFFGANLEAVGNMTANPSGSGMCCNRSASPPL